MCQHVTRLAPSPTGAMHLGNARTFLVNYLLARQRNWHVLMRVEDLDGPRVKAGAAEKALDDLAWLGLTWRQPVVYQSRRAVAYEAALQQLIDDGVAYPCVCSRKDIELAGGAPHDDDHVTVYPNTCRGRFQSAAHAEQKGNRPVAWRLQVNRESIPVADELVGVREFDLSRTCGDFVVCRTSGLAAYQLAVVVDDAAAGVDAIVRGDDLVESAARQIWIRRMLNLGPEPAYWHLPLIAGPDRRRLAKRHGDTRLSHYRELDVTPQRMLGLLGYWSGALDTLREAAMEELLDRFDIERLPREPTIFSPEDDAFLRSG